MSQLAVAQLTSGGWKSWQIALAIGLPAVVVGSYAYRKYYKTFIEKKRKELKQRGHVLFLKGDYTEAIKCYNKAILSIKIDFGHQMKAEELSLLYQRRAAAEECMDNYSRAIADYGKAIELDPLCVKACLRRSKLHATAGFLPECMQDLKMACVMEDFDNATNHSLIEEIKEEYCSKKATETLRNRMVHVLSPTHVWSELIYYSQDPVFNYNEAYFKGKKLTKMDAVESPFEKALEEFYSNDFNNIVGLCTEEINLLISEHKLEAHLMRGTYYYLSGQYDLGAKDFQTILDSKNVDSKIEVNAWIKLAILETQFQRISEDEVLKYFQRAQEVDPSNPDIYILRGNLYMQNEKFDEAISDFEKSISLNDKLPIPHINKCLAGILQHRQVDPYTLQEVRDKFDDIMEKFPLSADVHLIYGESLLMFEETSMARKLLDKAISLEPKNPILCTHKALFVLEESGLKACYNILDKAIGDDKNCTFTLRTLALVELASGNTLRGMELIKQAIDSSTKRTEMMMLYDLLVCAEMQSAKEEQALCFQYGYWRAIGKRIYTTMLGKKSSVKALTSALKENNIKMYQQLNFVKEIP